MYSTRFRLSRRTDTSPVMSAAGPGHGHVARPKGAGSQSDGDGAGDGERRTENGEAREASSTTTSHSRPLDYYAISHLPRRIHLLYFPTSRSKHLATLLYHYSPNTPPHTYSKCPTNSRTWLRCPASSSRMAPNSSTDAPSVRPCNSPLRACHQWRAYCTSSSCIYRISRTTCTLSQPPSPPIASPSPFPLATTHTQTRTSQLYMHARKYH